MDSATTSKLDIKRIGPLAAGFVLGLVVVGTYWLTSRDGETGHGDIVRNVTVDYMYESSHGNASGQTSLEVATIEFRPSYILMTDTRGSTRLLSLDRLRKFNYKPSEQ